MVTVVPTKKYKKTGFVYSVELNTKLPYYGPIIEIGTRGGSQGTILCGMVGIWPISPFSFSPHRSHGGGMNLSWSAYFVCGQEEGMNYSLM